VREKYCWLVAGGWFVLREKYCWLVADKPNEQGVSASRLGTLKCVYAKHKRLSVSTILPHVEPEESVPGGLVHVTCRG
jgi:hypothetical protein